MIEFNSKKLEDYIEEVNTTLLDFLTLLEGYGFEIKKSEQGYIELVNEAFKINVSKYSYPYIELEEPLEKEIIMSEFFDEIIDFIKQRIVLNFKIKIVSIKQ